MYATDFINKIKIINFGSTYRQESSPFSENLMYEWMND